MYRKQHRTRERKSRSVDFDCEPTKAAAWLWHLRSSSVRVADQYYGNPDRVFNGGDAVMDKNGEIMTNDRDVRRISRGQRSINRSREHSRFWQESRASSNYSKGNHNNNHIIWGSQRWDCGSDLYDAFELVSVSKRIDSSIMCPFIINATKPADRDGDSDMDSNLLYPLQADDFKFPATAADRESNVPQLSVQNRGNHRPQHLDRNRSERRLNDQIRRIIQKLTNAPDPYSDDSIRAPAAPASESNRRSSRRRTWERRFRAIIDGSAWRRLLAINSLSRNANR